MRYLALPASAASLAAAAGAALAGTGAGGAVVVAEEVSLLAFSTGEALDFEREEERPVSLLDD